MAREDYSLNQPVAVAVPDSEATENTDAAAPAAAEDAAAEDAAVMAAPTAVETDEDSAEAAKAQRAEDVKFLRENPSVPLIRAANPAVGGERF